MELPLPIIRYPSHKNCWPHLNGGGAEHPRKEGWSFPCLFCGTQVTRIFGPPPLNLLESLLTGGYMSSILASQKNCPKLRSTTIILDGPKLWSTITILDGSKLQSEGWSFPCLFCGTQITRIFAPPPKVVGKSPGCRLYVVNFSESKKVVQNYGQQP